MVGLLGIGRGRFPVNLEGLVRNWQPNIFFLRLAQLKTSPRELTKDFFYFQELGYKTFPNSLGREIGLRPGIFGGRKVGALEFGVTERNLGFGGPKGY